MNATTILIAVYIAFAYSGWPLVGKYVGISGAWVSLMVVVGTATSASALSAPGLASAPVPRIGLLAIVFCIGLLNGTGMSFHAWKSADPLINIGVLSMVIYMLQAVISPVGNSILNGSRISGWLIAAVGGSLFTIYCASRA